MARWNQSIPETGDLGGSGGGGGCGGRSGCTTRDGIVQTFVHPTSGGDSLHDHLGFRCVSVRTLGSD